jgi:hypothetical protein
MNSIFVAGLDLGQAQDYSALVLLEARGTTHKLGDATIEGPPLTRLNVRHIERFQLQTKYKTIAEQVTERIKHTPVPKYLAVDATGVGAGVVEMLMHLNPVRITITGGNQAQQGNTPQEFNVPKRDLVSALSVGVQNGILRIAKGLPHGELLVQEMLNFRAKISLSGHDSYEAALREGAHDDLVLAAAISVWCADLVFKVKQAEALERAKWDAAMERARGYQISAI